MKQVLCKLKNGDITLDIPGQNIDINELKKICEAREDVISARIIDVADLPKNRLFRDAWADISNSPKIDIDENKAKEVHLARIRESRNAQLEELDAKQLRHIADADKLKLIENEKQRLRDIPQSFDLSDLDISAPERCWPTDLPLNEIYEVN